jgi:hypothetical protein
MEIVQSTGDKFLDSQGEFQGDPNMEVVIVRDTQTNEALEVLLIPGLSKMTLGSNKHIEVLEAVRDIQAKHVDEKGINRVDYVFINKKGFQELLGGKDFEGLGQFIKSTDFSKLTFRVIQADS